MKSIASNSLWNLAAFAFGLIANLLTIPFVLRHIGTEAYGMASLIQAIIAPLTVFGTAIGQSTAQALSSRAIHARQLIATAGFLGLMCVSTGSALLFFGGKTIAVSLFRIDESFVSLLTPAFLVAAIGWAATVGSGVLQSIYIADQDYTRISQINAFGVFCMTVALFIFVQMKPTMMSYIIGVNIGFVSIFLAFLFFALKEKGNIVCSPAWHTRAAKIMSSFGGWQIAAQGSGVFANQADRYLLGAFVHSEAIAWYSVAQRLQEVAYIGVYKAGEVLFPVFGAEAESSQQRRADLFARSAWIMNTLAACVLGPVAALAHSILLIWTSKKVADNGAGILSTLALAGLIGSSANVLNFYLLGTGQSRINFFLAFLTAATACSVSAFLLPRFGLSAAGVGSLSAMCVQAIAVIAVIRIRFATDLDIPRLLVSFGLPLTIGIVFGFSFRSIGITAPTRWIPLCLQFGFVSAAILTLNIFCAALTKHGRVSLVDLQRIILSLTKHRI